MIRRQEEPEPQKKPSKWATVQATYFRGGWSPLLHSPQKPKPKAKLADVVVAAMAADDSFAPDPVPVEFEPVEIETATGDLLEGPPPDVDVLISVYDRNRDFRAYIAEDGEVVSNAGQVLGYINRDDCDVGSADMEFLGSGACGVDETVFVVSDSNDVNLVSVNLGTCVIREGQNVIAEIDGSGGVKSGTNVFLGEFDGFSYAHTKTMALYLALLDTGMLNEDEG